MMIFRTKVYRMLVKFIMEGLDMEDREEIIKQINKCKLLVLSLVEKHMERAVQNNDSEMVLALAESLKAVIKG